jgi:hypothetical protein
MKILSEEELLELSSGQIVYFEEDSCDSEIRSAPFLEPIKYRKWGRISRIEKNVHGVGYWITLTEIGDFRHNALVKNISAGNGFHRFSRWNKFYLPEKDKIINRVLQRQLGEIIDKFTNKDISKLVLGSESYF